MSRRQRLRSVEPGTREKVDVVLISSLCRHQRQLHTAEENRTEVREVPTNLLANFYVAVMGNHVVSGPTARRLP